LQNAELNQALHDKKNESELTLKNFDAVKALLYAKLEEISSLEA